MSAAAVPTSATRPAPRARKTADESGQMFLPMQIWKTVAAGYDCHGNHLVKIVKEGPPQYWLRVAQVAKALQVHHRTVNRWIESGVIPEHMVERRGPLLLFVRADMIEQLKTRID